MGATALARPRNPRGSGDRLRAELIDAVDAILDRTGDPAEVTVRGVASAVGVAPNAVYLHFADRDTLLTEVLVAQFGAMKAALDAAVEGIEDPLERLRAGHAAYCAFGAAHPGHYRVLFGANGIDPSRLDLRQRCLEVGLPAFEVLVDCCRRCIEVGAFAPVDPVELAAALWAFEHGWVDLTRRDDTGALLPDASRALDVLLAGLRAPARPAPPATARRRPPH